MFASSKGRFIDQSARAYRYSLLMLSICMIPNQKRSTVSSGQPITRAAKPIESPTPKLQINGSECAGEDFPERLIEVWSHVYESIRQQSKEDRLPTLVGGNI